MKKSKRSSVLVPLTVLAIASAVVFTLVFPASASTYEERGHWIDNLGSGYTALQFSGGNSNPACASQTFEQSSTDLWVFEVTGATDAKSIPRWDAAVPAWTSTDVVQVRDVTSKYGDYLPGATTKRLYIESSPPGARLNVAHLLYAGESASEVLLFTCAHDFAVELASPLVASYDMEYQWAVDANIDWKANHPYVFDIRYFTNRSRAPIPDIRKGSIHVRGSIRTLGPALPIHTLAVEYHAGENQQNCSVDLATLTFDCSIDEHFVTQDPTSGRPRGSGYVAVSIETPMGSATRRFDVDWSTIEPTNIFRVEARIRNHAAMSPYDEASVSPFATESVYQEVWTPSGNYCSTNRQVFELTTDPDPDPNPDRQLITNVTWCRPRPGYSLQYLGGPYGYPMLAASNADLRAKYPSVLGDLPPLATREDIRDFLGTVACLESCRTLFRAQFLTAAFNALDPAFADQRILIGDDCTTVTQYLDDVEAEASRLDDNEVVIRKAELERINGALITTCPTVSTSHGDPLNSEGG